jgi:hypothetical protein
MVEIRIHDGQGIVRDPEIELIDRIVDKNSDLNHIVISLGDRVDKAMMSEQTRNVFVRSNQDKELEQILEEIGIGYKRDG